MKGRFGLFVLIGVFLVGFVFAAESTIETEFDIDGCNYFYDGAEFGLAPGECSSGVAEGRYFCETGSPNILWLTVESGFGCALGDEDFSLGDDFCCPEGMYCVDDGDGAFECVPRLDNCDTQGSEGDCVDNGCYWMGSGEGCVADPALDYDCGFYSDESSCLADVWELGASGIGTEACGEGLGCGGGLFFSSCSCEWNASLPEGDRCHLSISAADLFDVASGFECSNVYELGDCIDGDRDVTWHSEIIGTGSYVDTSSIPSDCLDVLGCSDNYATIACGEDLIKLPGFGLFGFFFSLGIIAVYYFGVSRKEGF